MLLRATCWGSAERFALVNPLLSTESRSLTRAWRWARPLGEGRRGHCFRDHLLRKCTRCDKEGQRNGVICHGWVNSQDHCMLLCELGLVSLPSLHGYYVCMGLHPCFAGAGDRASSSRRPGRGAGRSSPCPCWLSRRPDFVTPRTLHWSLRKRRRRTTRWSRKLEMFDESIDRFEHSSWRPRRLCRPFSAGRSEDGWGCTFAHGEQELHPSTLRGAERGRASVADHG